MYKKCFIVGAGEFANKYYPQPGEFVIAADAGYSKLEELGIVPDLVVGDFDSLGAPPEHENIIQSPVEKDDTDLMLAVNEGFARGCDFFIIDGALGGRLDQVMANFQILANIAGRGARAVLLGDDMCATSLKDGCISFCPGAIGHKKLISVFCSGLRAQGVTLKGLKYPLTDAVLTCDYPLGVSNEFADTHAEISVGKGTLIIIWQGGVEDLE